MRLSSLEGRQSLLLLAVGAGTVLVYIAISVWLLPWLALWLAAPGGDGPMEIVTGPWLGMVITLALWVPLALWLGHRSQRPLRRVLRALEGSVASYRDGEYGFSIAARRKDELGDLMRLHNELGQTLRKQRQDLVQRELLLDTMVQKSPQALVLVDDHDRVTFANLAARRLLNRGTSMLGTGFAEISERLPQAMRAAIARGGDSMFALEMDGAEETFQLSLRRFRVQGRGHSLYLFRRMTRELSRQEVASWKRVIRVISHELNNSLAPIASMTHSGRELLKRGDSERLARVFDAIGERTGHLHEFIAGYARFAKLAAPRPRTVEWPPFLESLALHCSFRRVGALPQRAGVFDPGQLEQVVINLVGNAHQAGGEDVEVTLSISCDPGQLQMVVSDRGPGMTETVLAQAVLPFYSTRRDGTGLGLALAREIVEAHDGRLQLANREGGGLRVTLTLPQRESTRPSG